MVMPAWMTIMYPNVLAPTFFFVYMALYWTKTFLVMWALWILMAYTVWNEHFARRHKKDDEKCPSQKAKPNLDPMSDMLRNVKSKQKALRWAKMAVTGIGSKIDTKNAIGLTDKMTDRLLSWKQQAHLGLLEKMAQDQAKTVPTGKTTDKFHLEGKEKAECLDMNHLHLSWPQYLWASHFVSLPSMALLVYGRIKMLGLHALKKSGILKQPSDEHLRLTAGRLLLETSCAIQLVSISEKDGKEVGKFVWSSIPLIVDLPEGPKSIISCLSIEVELKAAKVASAKIHMTAKEEDVKMRDLMAILAHIISGYQHPKIHAYANWGIDPQGFASHVDPYLRQMAVVTTMYNHAGFHNAPGLFALFYGEKAGIAFADVVGAAMKIPTPAHPQVRKLMPYSKLVKFITELRTPFFPIFKEHEGSFPTSISGEAYFLGTILHSLDHAMYCRWIPQLDFVATTPSPQYQTMKGMQEMVRFSLSDDLPFIAFARFYREAPMAFHQKVYKAACEINKDLADLIQTCIIK
jgi:hypothetical protein